MKRDKKGFTLVEIITVFIIIGILLGLILTASFNAINQSKIEKAKADIKSLKAALEMFEADVGDYPVYTDTSGNGNDFNSWLVNGDRWVHPAGWTDYDNWHGAYMSFIGADILNNTHFLDPWGNGYRYYYNPATMEKFNLWSWGPDQTNNSGTGGTIGGDDIGG